MRRKDRRQPSKRAGLEPVGWDEDESQLLLAGALDALETNCPLGVLKARAWVLENMLGMAPEDIRKGLPELEPRLTKKRFERWRQSSTKYIQRFFLDYGYRLEKRRDADENR